MLLLRPYPSHPVLEVPYGRLTARMDSGREGREVVESRSFDTPTKSRKRSRVHMRRLERMARDGPDGGPVYRDKSTEFMKSPVPRNPLLPGHENMASCNDYSQNVGSYRDILAGISGGCRLPGLPCTPEQPPETGS